MVHEVVGTEVARLTSYILALELRAGDHAMMSDALESAFASSLKRACGTALLLAFGIGASETHLAIVIALNYIRSGVRGCFYSIVDLVSRIDAESCIPPGQNKLDLNQGASLYAD